MADKSAGLPHLSCSGSVQQRLSQFGEQGAEGMVGKNLSEDGDGCVSFRNFEVWIL